MKSISMWWKLLLLAAVLVAGCGADQITKRAVDRSIEVGQGVEIAPGFLELRHTRNEHASFGMLDVVSEDTRRPVLIALQLLGFTLAVILVVAWRRKRFSVLVPYILIAAGAAGNVLDRIFLGGVIDFIHVHYHDNFSWPIFNVADILITAGMGLLLIELLRRRKSPLPT